MIGIKNGRNGNGEGGKAREMIGRDSDMGGRWGRDGGGVLICCLP